MPFFHPILINLEKSSSITFITLNTYTEIKNNLWLYSSDVVLTSSFSHFYFLFTRYYERHIFYFSHLSVSLWAFSLEPNQWLIIIYIYIYFKMKIIDTLGRDEHKFHELNTLKKSSFCFWNLLTRWFILYHIEKSLL